jgi:NADH:ubiquinone oxidoreductase subunit 3 (subunit A)
MTWTYAQQYTFIAILAAASIGMGVAPLVLARFVAPKKPSHTKQAPYECGIESTGDSWVQFRVQYYVYALLFVIFDVEIIFLFPWALVWKTLGPVVFAEMVLFLVILGCALFYAWRKGVLEWET